MLGSVQSEVMDLLGSLRDFRSNLDPCWGLGQWHVDLPTVGVGWGGGVTCVIAVLRAWLCPVLPCPFCM